MFAVSCLLKLLTVFLMFKNVKINIVKLTIVVN